MKRVSKKEFNEFIKNYPRKLQVDVCGIWEPPLISYNDLALADRFPKTVVAMTYAYDDNPEDYYYEPEDSRFYGIEEGAINAKC